MALRACGPAALIVATWCFRRYLRRRVVRRLASSADETTAGLSPGNLGVGSQDSLLGYHYLGWSLVSPSSSVCFGT
jgi:hypothetical protein